MKLGNLLEEIKIGTEEYKAQNAKAAILETFDEKEEVFKTSKLLTALVAKLYESKTDYNAHVLTSIKKLANKFESVEDKVAFGQKLSKSYARMKLDMIREDYNSVVESLDSKKIAKSLDEELMAEVIALALYETKKVMVAADAPHYKLASIPAYLEEAVDREMDIVTESLM